MTVLNVIRRPVTVIVQGRGLMGFKGDKGDPGNLTGPASSVNENIPIFDGIAGDKLKDSGVKLSDKADTSAVTAGLLLKADITSLEIEKKLLMDEIDSLKKSAIENSNAPYLTVSDYGDVALAKNSVGVGTVDIDGVTVEQKVTNGNFVNTTGWSANVCTITASDNICTATFTSGNVNSGLIKAVTTISGHKYYISGYIYPKYNTQTYLLIGGVDGAKSNPVAGQWSRISSIITSSGTGNFAFWHSTISSYAAGDTWKYKNIICVDLTAYGLESLTTAQLDDLIPVYFDGKKTFSGVGCIKAVGKNLFDGKLEIGSYDVSSGNATTSTTVIRNKNKYIPIRKGYPVKGGGYTGGNTFWYYLYDKNKTYIGMSSSFTAISGYENAEYVNFTYTFPSAEAVNLDLIIQLEYGATASPYVPYSESKQYFASDPMYSNATLKDILTYSGGKYYHTHNVDADGNAIATPYDTEVETNGQFLALSEGTVTYEPWYPDIGIYTDKFTLTKVITAVKELYKYGSETPITDAVIAGDGLSFTSASLTAGDLAYGVFEFNEPLRPLMTIKSRNDDATIADTANGKVYTFRPVITNGAIASWTVTEV